MSPVLSESYGCELSFYEGFVAVGALAETLSSMQEKNPTFPSFFSVKFRKPDSDVAPENYEKRDFFQKKFFS